MASIQEMGGGRVCVADLKARVRLGAESFVVHGSVWLPELGSPPPSSSGDGVTIERIVDARNNRPVDLADLSGDEENAVMFAMRAAASEELRAWKAAS